MAVFSDEGSRTKKDDTVPESGKRDDTVSQKRRVTDLVLSDLRAKLTPVGPANNLAALSRMLYS